MFIELTEIVTEGIGSLSNPERNVVINTSKIQTLTIYPFSSQNILQYDRTALHIIKMKINFVATLRYRGLSFLWLVLLMVVEHGS